MTKKQDNKSGESMCNGIHNFVYEISTPMCDWYVCTRCGMRVRENDTKKK